MYNPFFLKPKVWQHLHVGPLSPHVDAFAQHLLEQGYATSTTYDKLHVVAKLSRWLKEHDLSVKALNEQHIAAFLHQLHRRQQRAQRGDRLEAGSRSVALRFGCRPLQDEATLFRELRTPGLPPAHVPVG